MGVLSWGPGSQELGKMRCSHFGNGAGLDSSEDGGGRGWQRGRPLQDPEDPSSLRRAEF